MRLVVPMSAERQKCGHRRASTARMRDGSLGANEIPLPAAEVTWARHKNNPLVELSDQDTKPSFVRPLISAVITPEATSSSK